MSVAVYTQLVFWLSLGGVLFAGYIAAHQLIRKECPFNEPCPYFLGRPACQYGFVLFLMLFAAAAAARQQYLAPADMQTLALWISLAGTLFAGYFVLTELISWMRSGMQRYGLIFPTCAYGLVFYALIFALSYWT